MSRRQGDYLDVGQVNVVLLKETNELLEIVFSWEIVTAVWPYCLKATIKNKLKQLKQTK